jgi:hypothetical protein
LKPLQTTAMLEAGLCLNSRGLALASASHDGSAAHLEVVREVLAAAGRSEADLATTPDLPYDRGEAERVIAAGRWPDVASDELLGQARGDDRDLRRQPLAGGRTPRRRIIRCSATSPPRSTVSPVVRWSHVGVDGCGAPTHMVTMVGLVTRDRRRWPPSAAPCGGR